MAKLSDASDELNSLRAEVSRLSDKLASRAYSEAEHAGTRVRETVSDLAHRAGDFASTARDRMGETSMELEDNISRNPWAAILIAGGVGLLLGMMSRRSD